MSIERLTSTNIDVTIKLTGEDIIKALVEAGYIDMPDSATCEFEVPGGGDYSNMSVAVDEDAKVVIRFTERE